MKPYQIIKGAVGQQALDILKYSMLIMKNNQYFVNKVPLEDRSFFADKEPVADNCWPSYSSPANEALLACMLPMVEEITGKELFPTYSFGRIYWRGASMPKHIDRPACEYSISLCVDVDPSPWAIWIDGDELILNPGDLVIYKGLEAEHWREEYKGNQQIQLFLHYVDKIGPHAEFKLDKRPMLGLIGKK